MKIKDDWTKQNLSSRKQLQMFADSMYSLYLKNKNLFAMV